MPSPCLRNGALNGMPRVVPSQVVTVLDQLFPDAKNQVEGKDLHLFFGHAMALMAIVDLVERIPDELLVLSVQEYSILRVSTAAIRTQVETWQMRGDIGPLTRVAGLPALSPITLIRQCLARCPDEFPAAATTELVFIADQDLREALRNDISSTRRALSNGEWKAATVLAGSVVEALLLWALQEHEQLAPADITRAAQALVKNGTLIRTPKGALEEWNLHDYIEVASALNLLKPEVAKQARLAKDFRNLIHPGRAQRLAQTCNRGSALSAVAAMELLIENLS